MTRELPQYGEYASPEVQAAAMGIPVSELHERTRPSTEHRSTVQQQGNPMPPVPNPGATAPPPYAAPQEAPRTRRIWDVALTLGLLAVGIYSVITSLAGLADLGATLTDVYATAGYGQYTNIVLADQLGFAANVVQVVLLVAAVALSLLSLRRQRMTFYIPLAFGIVATVIVFVLLMVAMLNDPAIGEWLSSQQ